MNTINLKYKIIYLKHETDQQNNITIPIIGTNLLRICLNYY